MLDWSFIAVYGPHLVKAAGITVVVAAQALVLATVLGLGLAFLRMARHPLPSGAAWTVIWLIRGTPLLLQMFAVYYALPPIGIRLSAWEAGVIALAVNSAAYYAEIFRAAIQAVPTGQAEAASAVGMTPAQAMRRIILVLAVRPAVPPYVGQSTTLVKNSSLVSVISVPDLMLTAQSIYSSTYKVVEVLLMTGVLYLAITSILQVAQIVAERRLGYYMVR
jgi:polar amino acid transport system permease protein/cystine transport system permease protein